MACVSLISTSCLSRRTPLPVHVNHSRNAFDCRREGPQPSSFCRGIAWRQRRQARRTVCAQSEEKPSEPVPEKFVAAKYSSQVQDNDPPRRELSDAMKKKIRDEYIGFGGSPNKPLKGNPFLLISGIIVLLYILTTVFG